VKTICLTIFFTSLPTKFWKKDMIGAKIADM
jgi:hypothetical protein